MDKKSDKNKKEENKEQKDNEELKKKNDELENKYKRALADYQNLQKRVIEEKQNWLKIANSELLLRLLPVLDTLLLAEKHNGSEEVKVIINQFLDILKAEEVTKIETIGKTFDPKCMEAVEVVEGEDGKILDEMRAGFMIYDKLLRPAQVRVGKKT